MYRKVVSNANGMTDHPEDIKTVWKNADAVCFDVDSTVIQEEAIDELAKFCGKEDQVLGMYVL